MHIKVEAGHLSWEPIPPETWNYTCKVVSGVILSYLILFYLVSVIDFYKFCDLNSSLSNSLSVNFVGKCIPITRGGGIYQEHMNEALDHLRDGSWVLYSLSSFSTYLKIYLLYLTVQTHTSFLNAETTICETIVMNILDLHMKCIYSCAGINN